MTDRGAQPHHDNSTTPRVTESRLRRAQRTAGHVAYAIAVTSPLLTEQDRQRIVADRHARE